MLLTTLGHATLLLKQNADAAPLLTTDPWVLGSCYWRSWWLERYPSAAQIDEIARARFCYLTHEHPDHFHTPSIRRLGRALQYLVPEFSRDMMGNYLREHGFSAKSLEAGAWHTLGDDVRVLSVPTLGNDSALLIDTKEALIANMNDARPSLEQLLALRALRRAAGSHKPCVLLASYSAAGIGNSMYKDGTRVDFASKGRHVRYVLALARTLEADVYIPFASQVSFERPDTRWANDFKVRFDDVREQLTQHGVTVLPPHTTLDLSDMSSTSEHGTEPHREQRIAERVTAQIASEASKLEPADLIALASKLSAAGRAVLPLLFPRGVAFDVGTARYLYRPLSGKLEASERRASMTLRVPAQALKDVLATGYFSDLCIPMFTQVDLAAETPPAFVYAFFVLMQLHDVGVTTSTRDLTRWLRLGLTERWRLARASLPSHSGSSHRPQDPSLAHD